MYFYFYFGFLDTYVFFFIFTSDFAIYILFYIFQNKKSITHVSFYCSWYALNIMNIQRIGKSGILKSEE